MKYRFWIVMTLMALGACATQEQAKVSDAVTTPLSDLNLIRKDIPAILQTAMQNAYAPAPTECDTIWQEVMQLDAVLGPDLDKPADKAQAGLLERGSDVAKESAIKAIGRTAEGVVPFRSWVRKLSGAEKHDRQVAAAIAAGAVRRAYLKGIWVASHCH